MSDPLKGWTVKDWAIRPSMLIVINLMDLRPHSGMRRHLGKLFFVKPTKIIFSNLACTHGVEWLIEATTFDDRNAESTFCQIKIAGGGSIEVNAEEHHTLFW